MKKIIILFVSIILLNIVAFNAWAGYYTANDYMKMPESEQYRYLAGVIDGIGYGLTLSDPEESDRFDKQVAGKELRDIRTIVNNYITDSPEHWRYPMSEIIYTAIKRTSK